MEIGQICVCIALGMCRPYVHAICRPYVHAHTYLADSKPRVELLAEPSKTEPEDADVQKIRVGNTFVTC